jgi:exodeoxyribonuclease VII small subunit
MAIKTFRESYGVLQQHAQTLREQTEPNIDDLLTIVTESVEAYKVCKERIDAVELALKDALTGTGVEAAAPAAPAAKQSPKTPAADAVEGDADDDIPF